MTPPLIGLVGRAGTGKDTIASALGIWHRYKRVAFADALKTAALDSDPMIATLFGGDRLSQLVARHGWDEAKQTYPDVRRYLQRYGVAMRDQLPGCWVTIAARHIGEARAAGLPVVVTDVRFADELQMIVRHGGMIVRVTRPGAPNLGDNAQHVSETNVDRMPADMEVANDRPLREVHYLATRLHAAALTPRVSVLTAS